MGRGGRGRGRGGSKHNRKGRANQPRLSSKDATHLKQFGEMHPSQELSDINPPSSKRFKKGSTGFSDRKPHNFDEANNNSGSSASESEDEVTPYGELLSMLSGPKKYTVEIVSESEEEDESENDLEEEEDDEEEEEKGHEDNQTPDGKVTAENMVKDNEGIKGNESELSLNKDEEDDENGDQELKEEKVILDEELDPEAKENDSGDPFLLHFERELPTDIQQHLKTTNKIYTAVSSLDLPSLENVQFCGIPPLVNENRDEGTKLDNSQRKYAVIPSAEVLKKSVLHNSELLHVKQQILNRIGIVNQACLDAASCPGPLTPFQSELLGLLTQYVDIYFPEETLRNRNLIEVAYCVHVANHILKTRTRILHHNAKMASKNEVPEEFRDQSFVRPKVLILVPFKESALRIVKILISLILDDAKGMVANKKRFIEEYSGDTLFMPKTNPKPEDYMATFAGNIDDNFKLGISLTKKSVKLYTDFYSSDIIIASPLGLRMIIGAEGEAERDYDFLSSIEVTVMDQADVFLMQNWDHLIHVFKHLHLQPLTTHGTDFGRIRPWAVDGLTKHYCQTLMFSSINCPELIALFSRHCKNYAGLIKLRNPILKGSISHVTVQLPQVFQKFGSSSVHEVNDARFEFFVNKVLPNFSNKLMSQTLIFVSSYFDFVRLRNYFKREGTSFVQICEYTKDKKIARARDLFFHGENHFLLYTERAMFFRRFRLKGIGHIIFYQLPQYPHFYSELCNFIQEDFQSKRVRQRKNSSVTALYCQYDASRLAAIVGSERASFMLSSDKKVHAFVTGELE